jgi:hypothetical protein
MEKLTLTSELLYEHDVCQRACTWNRMYAPFRCSLNKAMNTAIWNALAENDPNRASETIMSLAVKPGIDIEGSKVYDGVIHTSRLCEVLSTYLLSVEKCSLAGPVTCEWGQYEFKSFLMPDGRLRRVVLCDRWSPEREQLERFSWRTAADCCISNRPMLLNILVIGSQRGGLRSSPWVRGFQHPKTGEVRVQKREGKFVDSWREVYRENTTLKALDWLRIMQGDGAFEGRVFSVTQEPVNQKEVLAQVAAMAKEMGSMRQTRSSCYRFRPCPFLPACSQAKSPAQLGWVEKDSLINQPHAILTPTI